MSKKELRELVKKYVIPKFTEYKNDLIELSTVIQSRNKNDENIQEMIEKLLSKIEEMSWFEWSHCYGYEHADMIIPLSKNSEFWFWLISKDNDGNDQVEIPGGKISHEEEGNPSLTAFRETLDETGFPTRIAFQFTDDVWETYGGVTGMPSIQVFVVPMDYSLIHKLNIPKKEKFIGAIWGKPYKKDGKWYVMEWSSKKSYSVHEINTFFLEQHVIEDTEEEKKKKEEE